jgi:phosphoribosyl-AMP cyclohydrolase
VLKVHVDAGQCHVGYESCFYRGLKRGSREELEFIAEKVYKPAEIYEKQG